MTMRNIDRANIMLTIAVVTAIAAGGCATPAAYQDKGGVNGAQPDKISDVDYTEVFRNSDGVPTIAMSCVRGLAFASPASNYSAGDSSGGGGTYFFRLPEWDATCKTKVK